MNSLTNSPFFTLGAIIVVAAVLFAVGHLLTKRRQAPPALIGNGRKRNMLPLMDAAAAIYETAKREKMVIVTVADANASGPAEWFAQSMVSVVPVYRLGAANTFEKLERGTGIGLQVQALYIRKTDYQTYIRWARSMQ